MILPFIFTISLKVFQEKLSEPKTAAIYRQRKIESEKPRINGYKPKKIRHTGRIILVSRIKIEKAMSNSTSPSLLEVGIFTYVPASFFNRKKRPNPKIESLKEASVLPII